MGKQGKVKKMSEALKVYSVQNIQHPFETLWENVQFSKDFWADGAQNSKSYNYFHKEFA